MRKHRKASGYNTRPDRNAGRALSDIAAQPIVWVIPGLVPRDALTLLLGNPGCGKSLLTQTWAGTLSQQGMTTLLLSAEDVPESVLVPRFTACQADTRRIFIPTHPLTLPTRMPALRALVVQHHPALLVLDLLDSFSTLSLSHAGNTHTILGELIGLARHYHLGVVDVVHEGKTGKRDLHRILGSVELAGMARSVIVVEDDTQGRKRLRHLKCNVAPLHDPISFRIESVAVGQGMNAPVIIFEDEREKRATPGTLPKKFVPTADYSVERGHDGNTVRLMCPCVDANGKPTRLVQQMSVTKLRHLGAVLRDICARDHLNTENLA